MIISSCISNEALSNKDFVTQARQVFFENAFRHVTPGKLPFKVNLPFLALFECSLVVKWN